jgi:O-antigen/teichoic acid export membrane protein
VQNKINDDKVSGGEFSKDTILLALGRLSIIGSRFIIGILVTKAYGVESYGKFDLAVTIYTFGMILVAFQLESAIMRFGSKARADLGQIIASTFLFQMIIGIVYLCGVFIFFGLDVLNLSIELLFILASTTSIISVFFNALRAYLSASRKFNYLTFVLIFSSILTLIFTLIFELLLNIPLIGYFLARFLSEMIGLIIILRILKRSKVRINLNFQYLRKLLRYSSPLLPNALIVWAVIALPRFMVNAYYDELSLGILGLAFTITIPFTLVSASFETTWSVRFFESYHIKSLPQDYMKFYNLYISLASLTYSGSLLLSPLISFIYLNEINILVILIFSILGMFYFIIGLNQFTMVGIWLSNRTEFNTLIQFTGLILEFILMYLMVSRSVVELVAVMVIQALLVHFLFRYHLFKTRPNLYTAFPIKNFWRMSPALVFFVFCSFLLIITDLLFFLIIGVISVIISLFLLFKDYRKITSIN